jgi:hypothetical protein
MCPIYKVSSSLGSYISAFLRFMKP